MLARRLILTANEYAWPKHNKEPVLFLGEWCRRYSRKAVWQQLDAEVAPYHWDDRQKLFNDYQYLQDLYEKLLFDLSNKLNHIHSVNYSLRYWRILIGPWLGFFIQILFDRWFMLKQTIEKEKITKCVILDREPLSVVPNDMKHFSNLNIDDDWNEAIYAELLSLCWSDRINIQKIKKTSANKIYVNNKDQKPKSTFTGHIKKLSLILLNKLFLKNDGYFFISSYFSLKTEFILQINIRQFPKIWHRPSTPIIKPNIKKRQWRLDCKFENTSFENVVRQFIPLHIPTAYLEGFNELEKVPNQCGWPNKPKVIFTSNDYNSCDVFKKWAAEKTESGSSLVIGQHGGHFGMTPFAFMEKHQIDIADKWLSWGWSDKHRPKIIPIGNFKNQGRKVKYDPNGIGLMVENCSPRYTDNVITIPLSSQWLEYLDDQKKFLRFLPEQIRKQVLVRLFSHDYGWDQKDRWKNEMPEQQIDSGNQDIKKLIKKCRFYISTYNATTYLESLYWNVPTIIFWNQKHWEINEDVKPYFELLKSVGIFHNTPESAAKKLIDVWGNVDLWWKTKEVQNVRQKFCNQFSMNNQNLIANLKKILVD